MIEYCVNCECKTKFNKKTRFYLKEGILKPNQYYECSACFVEKDLKITASDLTFSELKTNEIERD